MSTKERRRKMDKVNISELISMFSDEVKEMKIELSQSKADYKFKERKKERIEVFQLLQKKLLHLHQFDMIFRITEQVNILQKRDSEMDGIYIIIQLKPNAKKFGSITITNTNLK